MNTRKTTIKAVTFDLWNTLLFESDGASTQRAVTRCKNITKTLNKLGTKVTETQVSAAINETINWLLKIWDTNKDVTHQDQLRFLIRFATNGKVTLQEKMIPELSAAYISSIYEIPPYINPDARRALQLLQKQNHPMGLICNTGITPGFTLRDFLTQQSIAEYFKVMTFSDETGIRKPDPKIFQLTARKLETEPDETVHVGDNIKADIWGAKTAGLKAIHFKTEKGKDQTAMKDPKSLATRSMNLGQLKTEQTSLKPDKIITSLATLPKAIKELNKPEKTTRSRT